MRRAALLSLLLALCLPAGAQPYSELGPALLAQQCNRACVCREPRPGEKLCTPPLDCRPFDPSAPFFGASDPRTWLRYGFPVRPPHISDGGHSGSANIRQLAFREDNPLNLVRPYTWTEQDEWDAAKLWTSNGSCRAVVLARFAETPSNGCPPGYGCESLPQRLIDEYLAGTKRFFGIPFQDSRLCYLEQSSRVTWNSNRPECDPAQFVEPPPPPPPPSPPEPCGNGEIDEGETCETCPADMPPEACDVVNPPPPPPSTACEELWAAVAKVCPR